MHAITGITGKVGGALAATLLAAGQPVRAIVRDAAKGAAWAARGCEIALADMNDATALTAAFAGAEAVFILPPSEFDPAPGYGQARATIDAIAAALIASRPGKVLCLSTIGADAAQDNLLTQRTLLEQALSTLPIPVTFLRPGWFLENSLWDVASAREDGVIRSFLAPLDKPFPMVATKDIGTLAARLIQENWSGKRVRTGRPTPRVAERPSRRLRESTGTSRARRDRCPRQLGDDVSFATRQESLFAHPDARRIQRGLDRLRRRRRQHAEGKHRR
jgi:NAD(P)H dehydrogenase (quinone)